MCWHAIQAASVNPIKISLCSASYISWQTDIARVCCWAPAVQQSIVISWLPGPKQQTHRNGVWQPNDRRTDARQFHRPCSAYYASSVNKLTEQHNSLSDIEIRLQFFSFCMNDAKALKSYFMLTLTAGHTQDTQRRLTVKWNAFTTMHITMQ